MTQITASVDAGSTSYWSERRIAYRLIREAEQAAIEAARAPLYLFGGCDEDGEAIPIENIQPLEDLAEAVRAVRANPVAASIMTAQGRTRIGDERL